MYFGFRRGALELKLRLKIINRRLINFFISTIKQWSEIGIWESVEVGYFTNSEKTKVNEWTKTIISGSIIQIPDSLVHYQMSTDYKIEV